MEHPPFFVHKDERYDLTHLRPFMFNLTLQAHKSNPELEISLRVEFTNHCYTEGAAQDVTELNGVTYDEVDHYEWPRWYNTERYNTSLLLPDFVRQIHTKKCLFTKRQNWLIIELEEENGTIVPFYLIFSIWAHKNQENSLGLRIVSAYKKTKEDNAPKRGHGMDRISFAMLARKTLANVPIKRPRRR